MTIQNTLVMLGTVSAFALGVPVHAQSFELQTGTEVPAVSPEFAGQTESGPVQIIIAPRIRGDEQANLSVERLLAFGDDVRLGLRTDPKLVPPERVIQMIESIGMVDDAGLRIVSGYDISLEHDLVVASSAGSVEIMAVHNGEHGLVVTALVRDDQGNIIDPPEGSLAVYTTNGERLCFAEEVINSREVARNSSIDDSGLARVPMSFVILLDRSGSMASHIDEVRAAAHSFLDALPDNAVCSVGAFASSSASFERSEGFGFQNQCRADAFSLEGLGNTGGATNLFRPLENAYRWLDAWHQDDEQRLVIMITDGSANRELEREEAVRNAKGNIRTLVYHVGGQEERFLQSLADGYLAHEGDLEDSLSDFFEVVSETYSSQTVLRLGQCEAPEG